MLLIFFSIVSVCRLFQFFLRDIGDLSVVFPGIGPFGVIRQLCQVFLHLSAFKLRQHPGKALGLVPPSDVPRAAVGTARGKRENDVFRRVALSQKFLFRLVEFGLVGSQTGVSGKVADRLLFRFPIRS